MLSDMPLGASVAALAAAAVVGALLGYLTRRARWWWVFALAVVIISVGVGLTALFARNAESWASGGVPIGVGTSLPGSVVAAALGVPAALLLAVAVILARAGYGRKARREDEHLRQLQAAKTVKPQAASGRPRVKVASRRIGSRPNVVAVTKDRAGR